MLYTWQRNMISMICKYHKAPSSENSPNYFISIFIASVYNLALFLSRYLKIQLEDLKDYQRALSYIGRLDFYEVQYTEQSRHHD